MDMILCWLLPGEIKDVIASCYQPEGDPQLAGLPRLVVTGVHPISVTSSEASVPDEIWRRFIYFFVCCRGPEPVVLVPV